MQDKDELIRLPARLFKGDDLYLPLNSLGYKQSDITLKIPKKFLKDQSIRRLAYDEYHRGGFESVERSMLMKLIPEDGIFLDIGAHFGLYSVFLAYHKSKLNCFAFEPAPDNFAVLLENCACNVSNRRVSCFPKAVGAHSGVGFLRTNTSMGHHVVKSPETSSDSNVLEIEVYTLDEILTKLYKKYPRNTSAWIKIDVEGRELDVLSGGKEILKEGAVDGILWEYSVGPIENPHKDEINRFLGKAGFTSYIVSESNIISVRDQARRTESERQIIRSLPLV
ncbi:FkbM family methyltransferase [Nisaea sp.]|uniref:FkbM family methyltransferase n=1 Tax=Nisaea sp. TaxID=2024842 RepID=UPI003B51B3A1